MNIQPLAQTGVKVHYSHALHQNSHDTEQINPTWQGTEDILILSTTPQVEPTNQFIKLNTWLITKSDKTQVTGVGFLVELRSFVFFLFWGFCYLNTTDRRHRVQQSRGILPTAAEGTSGHSQVNVSVTFPATT